jgi:hypothetical protein
MPAATIQSIKPAATKRGIKPAATEQGTMTAAPKQGTMSDAVEKEAQGCGEVKEIDEVDFFLQYCVDFIKKSVYVTQHQAQNNVLDWNDVELETGETYEG